jgi:hypothetical protein
MGDNQNTTIPDLMIEPTTIVKTKYKNNQYVNNNVNKINNNLRQPKHNIEQQTSDNNLKQNAIDNQQPPQNTINQLVNDNYEDHIYTINKPTHASRIHGYAIFNKTLMNYLFDTGANTSIIQKKIFNQIIKDDVTTQVVEYKGKLKSYTTEIKTFGQILLNQCNFNRTDNHKGVKIIITEDQETLNICIIGTDMMKIISDFKNIIITLEKTIETMSSDVLQRYNRNVLNSIRISSNECDNINTIDTVSNNQLVNDELKMNNTRIQLEQRLKECAATSLDSIMVKNPTRVKFNIELINSNQQPCAKARPLPYILITSP